jgi:protein-disulfide isomerase
VESADDSGVAGTPTFFLNEVRYRGPLERAALAEALDRAARIAQGRAELATAD